VDIRFPFYERSAISVQRCERSAIRDQRSAISDQNDFERGDFGCVQRKSLAGGEAFLVFPI